MFMTTRLSSQCFGKLNGLRMICCALILDCSAVLFLWVVDMEDQFLSYCLLRAEASFCRPYEPSVCNMQLDHFCLILVSSCIALTTGAMAEWKYLHQPDSYSSSPVKVQKITCFVNYTTAMETQQQLHHILHISLVKQLVCDSRRSQKRRKEVQEIQF